MRTVGGPRRTASGDEWAEPLSPATTGRSTARSGAVAQNSEAAVNQATPMTKSRRRPYRSPRLPPASDDTRMAAESTASPCAVPVANSA
jgi:hypothetical protein